MKLPLITVIVIFYGKSNDFDFVPHNLVEMDILHMDFLTLSPFGKRTERFFNFSQKYCLTKKLILLKFSAEPTEFIQELVVPKESCDV